MTKSVNLDNIEYMSERVVSLVLRVLTTMKSKWAILAVLGAFLLFVPNPASGAINTRRIGIVLNKDVLGPEDLEIIDDFVAEAVRELVRTRDFSEVGKVRRVILDHASSDKPSKAQYERQFFESAHKYISEALKKAKDDNKFMVAINLLILVDRLENLQLADLAIGMLKDENTVIRYLAVDSVTNPSITKQLNSAKSSNSKLAQQIAKQLKGLVESSSPETMALMVKFAADVKIPQADDLLLHIADVRIKSYADWTVEYEPLDATILKSLLEKISSAGPKSPAIARCFGQLYSYAVQRYIKGQNYLSAAQKQYLASVLVETEHKCIRNVLGPTIKIKKAVEQDNYEVLWLEHNRVLGDESRAGLLPRKWKFHYGVDRNGKIRTAPLTLPEPPKTKVSK